MLLEELRDQLRDAIVDLKSTLLDPVPAEEVFFVRDVHGDAHVAGHCVATRPLPRDAKWESVTGRNLTKLEEPCECLHLSPDFLRESVTSVEKVMGPGEVSWILWVGPEVSLRATFPVVFDAWTRVHRLYVQLVLSDPTLLDYRAERVSVSVSHLPAVGMCTVQDEFPEGLKVFPNGVSVVVPQVELPEVVAHEFVQLPRGYKLCSVEGWTSERVEVLTALLRDTGSMAPALAAFKLAEQIVL